MNAPRPLIRHISFYPIGAGLAHVCEAQEQDGYALMRIVFHHQYQSVAVFELVPESLIAQTSDAGSGEL